MDDWIAEMHEALAESIKLQSQYATLLNMYDGGQRLIFENADAWIDRLRMTRGGDKK